MTATDWVLLGLAGMAWMLAASVRWGARRRRD